MGRRVNLTVNGQVIRQEFIDDEWADGVERYNFKDMEELSHVLYHVSRCTRKNIMSWCPADTKALKAYLGMEG